ncbi:hypothetical protein [Pseudomonas anguilliseptica]|uniref:hypothetical protein n=1 Tax=Pseudomonas anguilliseptica TaxID=53406 RepID=UPI003736218A
MIDLQLDIRDLEVLRHEKNKFMEKDLLDLSKKHLGAGNRIVIKRSYIDTPDECVESFTDQKIFEEFWCNFFK